MCKNSQFPAAQVSSGCLNFIANGEGSVVDLVRVFLLASDGPVSMVCSLLSLLVLSLTEFPHGCPFPSALAQLFQQVQALQQKPKQGTWSQDDRAPAAISSP